ncbi:MAG: hypothetical protein V3U71_02185 [Cocleimonas sp.]
MNNKLHHRITKGFSKLLFLFLILLLNTQYISAANLSTKCVFNYNETIYEWLKIDQFTHFQYINDSGQAVASDFTRRGNTASINLFDSNRLFGPSVVAGRDFRGDYNAFVEIAARGMNNDGEIFGDVFLANEIPDNAPPEDANSFRNFSSQFSFIWDKENKLRDLSTLVQGLSGPEDIGLQTTIITEPRPPRFQVLEKSAETNILVPFDIREKQNHIVAGMLTSISNQCGSEPTGDLNINEVIDSNTNLEFITSGSIVRFAKPRLNFSVGSLWRVRDSEGNVEFIDTNRRDGEVGDGLIVEIFLENVGPLDISEIQYTITADNALQEDFKDSFMPNFMATDDENQRVSVFYSAIKSGDPKIQLTLTAIDQNGDDIELKKEIQVRIAGSPPLETKLRFTDRRSNGRLSLNEEFGVTIDIEVDEKSDGVENIVVTPNFIRAPNLEIVSAPNIPAKFDLVSTKKRSFNWILRAKSPGRWRITATAEGTDISGSGAAKGFDDFEGSVGGLQVTVTTDKSSIELDENDEGPIPVPVNVKVVVRNPTHLTMKNVILTAKKPSIVTLTERDITVIPFIYLKLANPKPLPIMGAPEPIELADIPPGESIEVSYIGQAQDDGIVKLEFVATANADNKKTTGISEAIVNISSDILLHYEDEASLREIRENSSFWVDGGDKWRITIKLENRSAEKTLDVELLPVTRGNASYAVPLPLGVDAPDVACPTAVRRTLEPGERETFFADVFTSPDGGTRGEVGYSLRVWSHEIIDDGTSRRNVLVQVDNDKHVLLKEGSAIVKQGTNGDFHTTSVDVRNEVPPVPSNAEWAGAFAIAGLKPFAEVVELLPVLVELSYEATKAGVQFWKYPEYYSAAADKTAALIVNIYEGMDETAREAWKLGVVGSLVKAGMKQEEALKAFNGSIVNVFLPLTEAHYNGDSLAVARWYGGLTGNVAGIVAGPETLAARLAGKLSICKIAVTKVSTSAATKISPRAIAALRRGGASATRVAEKVTALTAKAMPNGAVLRYAEHVRDIFGVDIRTHQKLKELSENWGIVAVVRRRGQGAIKRLKTGLYTPKPSAIQAKNVSHIDTDWLGFKPRSKPDGIPNGITDLTDEVGIRKPPKWTEVESKLKASGESDEFIKEVRERHTQRSDEFEKELTKWNKYAEDDVGIPYPKSEVGVDFRDNVVESKSIKAFADDSTVLTRQKFEIEQIFAEDGAIIYRPRIQRPDGKWQYVTGDVDPMAFVKPNGRPLSEQQRLVLYRELKDIGIQHPESMTWTNKKARDKYFEEFSANNPDSEPLLAYLPNGQQISTRFEPRKSWLEPGKINRRLLYFAGMHAVIQSPNPTPTDIAPITADNLGTFISPNTTFINDPNCTAKVPKNTKVSRTTAKESDKCIVEMSRDSGSSILRLTDEGIVEQWTASTGWKPYEIESSTITMAPQTIVTDVSVAGTNTLEIRTDSEMSVLAGEDEWFNAGDRVVIDPGGPNQETAVIAAFGSLVFTSPLNNNHFAGEWISLIEANAINIDTDNDGIPNGIDAFPTDPNESIDTDNDGIGNNADPDDDNDGFSDIAELNANTDPLDSNSRPSGQPMGTNESIPSLSEWAIILLTSLIFILGSRLYRRKYKR